MTRCLVIFFPCCRRDLYCESDSLGTEVTQTIYRRSTLLAILSLVSCLSLLFAINGINDLRVEWTTRTACTSNLRSYGRFPQVLWRLMLIWLKISFLLPVLQSWFRDLAEASIRLSTRIPKFWGALECSFALNVLPLDAQSSVSLILRPWLRWKTLYIPGSSGPFSTSSSTTLSAYSLIWFLFCQLVKGVIFCPSCIHEEPLKFQSCPGKFVIKRAAGDRLVRLLVETPCSDHILPPRIRQTTAEKEHHAAVVKAHGRVPISQRDPAGMVNSELHQKRTYRIRSTLQSSGLDKLDGWLIIW